MLFLFATSRAARTFRRSQEVVDLVYESAIDLLITDRIAAMQFALRLERAMTLLQNATAQVRLPVGMIARMTEQHRYSFPTGSGLTKPVRARSLSTQATMARSASSFQLSELG